MGIAHNPDLQAAEAAVRDEAARRTEAEETLTRAVAKWHDDAFDAFRSFHKATKGWYRARNGGHR